MKSIRTIRYQVRAVQLRLGQHGGLPIDPKPSIDQPPWFMLALHALIAISLANTAASQIIAPARPGTNAGANTNVTVANTTLLNQPANIVTLPTGKAATQGFTSTIELPESKLPGYVPVSVVLQSNTTFTRDRQLVLRVTPIAAGHSPPTNLVSAEIPLSIDQGTTRSRTTHYIPHWSVGNAYRLEFFENGRAMDEYKTEVGDLNLSYAGIPSRELLTESDGQWVYIRASEDDIPTDAREICAAVSGLSLMSLPEPAADPWYWSHIEAAGYYRSLAKNQLPRDWRGYQSLDAVLVSHLVLENLRNVAPDEFRSLRQWMLCGGTIVLTDLADADAIEDLFGVTRIQREGLDANSAILARSARGRLKTEREMMKAALDFVSAGTFGQGMAGYLPHQIPGWNGLSDAAFNSQLVLTLPTPQELALRLSSDLRRFDKLTARQEPEWKESFCVLGVAAGKIIGLKKEAEADIPRLMQWRMVNELIGYHKSAMLRRGVDPILGDSRAKRWLIPGVAEPPVYTFIGLLGAFVVLVGPVAYRRTSRQGRSHLMFAIAPALALATTVAMFGYGIIADGFGTSARVRQLTWIDGTSGDAAERVRATYFAGIRPGNGLRFPADSEVFPYQDSLGQSWESIHGKSPGGVGRVRISDAEQRFDSSFLPSRQQEQFVFHRPRTAAGTLSLVNDPNGAILSSTFAAELRELIVRDRGGNYWTTDIVPADKNDLKCDPLLPREASKRLGELYLEHRPLSRIIDNSGQARRSRSYRNETVDLMTGTLRKLGLVGTVNVLDGAFEQTMQQWLQTDGELPRSSFVALSDVSEDVISVDDAELIESVHYIFGTLAP